MNADKVRKGQKWQDWDIRFRHDTPRIVTVLRVNDTHAIVESNCGRKSKIRLNRFKANSTGYKLVGDL
jgi:hypothetical protein